MLFFNRVLFLEVDKIVQYSLNSIRHYHAYIFLLKIVECHFCEKIRTDFVPQIIISFTRPHRSFHDVSIDPMTLFKNLKVIIALSSTLFTRILFAIAEISLIGPVDIATTPNNALHYQ